MAQPHTKFYKREQKSLSALEQEVGKALVELENSSSSYKADLQTIFATSAQEYSIVKDNKKSKKVVVITIPYPCLKPLQKVHRALVVDLERKLRAQVLVTAKRTILSRWLKTHKSQQRPRSRTLTAVYDSILDDLVLPSVIIGKRIRVRLDGSRFYRITLDQNDKALLEEKVDGIQHVYKKLTTREINIEFAPDVTYHTLNNNAGILRDITFQKMTDLDWNLIMKVHVNGTYSVTRAAWDIMRQQGYGRIINTGSGSGIYGSFGQANYSTAKLGIHGLTLTLAKEGEKRNIRVNTIAPIAASRMTETVLPKEALANLDPKHIVPLVGYLAHESCEETGSLFEIAAGFIAKLRWQRAAGALFDLPYTAEEVRDRWNTICDFEKNPEYPTATSDTFAKVNENVERIQLKREEAAKKAATTAPAAVDSPYKSDQIFTMMKVFLERGEGTKLVKDLQAVYGFNIVEKKNGPVKRAYTIDLKNGQGAVVFQEAKTADATFTMIDGDFEQVCLGKLNPNNAFMTGKMKIKGHMGKATKFTPALFPPPTPENIAKYTPAKL